MTLGRNRVPRWAENHERAITLRFFIFFLFLANSAAKVDRAKRDGERFPCRNPEKRQKRNAHLDYTRYWPEVGTKGMHTFPLAHGPKTAIN